MAEGAEKRRCHRFEIPGGKGKYKKEGLLVLLRGYSKAYPVVNVSKGGLAFVCEEDLDQGEKVLVQLFAPHEEPLELHAVTCWQGRLAGREETIAGVEFAAFGERSGHNSLESLEVLRRLEGEYGPDDDAEET